MTTGSGTTRRGFLDYVIAVGSAITTVAVAIPGLLYLWPAARGGASEEVEVKGAKEMKPGDHSLVQIRGKAVIVVRKSAGFVAYSGVCTHLGCLVKYQSASDEFFCPCHAAIFAGDGSVVSGPAPGPLPAYQVKEIGEKVYVSEA